MLIKNSARATLKWNKLILAFTYVLKIMWALATNESMRSKKTLR